MPQGQRTTTNYSVYASGHQQCGKSVHFGTEVWVSRSIPVAHTADGKPVFLGREKPTVLHTDPRCLILRFDGAFRLTIVAAHAPCLGVHNGSDEVEQWWQNLTTLCSTIDDGSGFLCCIDANAPLASQATEFYGMCGAETPNRQTRWFQSFLGKSKLYAPATLGCHLGDHHTWIHPKKFKLRRDFILVNKLWFSMVSKSRTLQSFDTGMAHVDHVPALVDFKGALMCTLQSPHSLDRTLIQSVDGQSQFQQALASLPMPTWDVNVDRHCDYLQHNIMQIARQVFASRPRKQQVRPQLTESTLNFINFKRQILQMVRTAPPEEMHGLVKELREVEKEVRAKVGPWPEMLVWWLGERHQSIWWNSWSQAGFSQAD